MRIRPHTLFCTLALTALPGVGLKAQVPPPPPMPGQNDIAAKIEKSLISKDINLYKSLLADDLSVFDDGKLIASSREKWISIIEPKLVAKGVEYKVTSEYASTSRVLFIEYFNSLGSWGTNPPPDCCWEYDAVAYDIHAGKITRIQRLRGGDVRRTDEDGNQDSR